MADKKISALTGATTPLAGTEVLPIVQSGATVKVAVSDLTAGRAVSCGPLTVTGAATVSEILTAPIVQKNGTYTAGATTPSVQNITFMVIANSSLTTITNFTNATDGQIIYLKFNDSNTIVDRSNAYLAGGLNFVSTSNDTLVLLKVGSYWFEISRSLNA